VGDTYLSCAVFPEEKPDSLDQFKIQFESPAQDPLPANQVSIYDECVLPIAPCFMVHPVHYKSLTFKLSLEEMVPNSRDLTTTLLSFVNRGHNQRILAKLAFALIAQKHLSLIGVSKFFNKLN